MPDEDQPSYDPASEPGPDELALALVEEATKKAGLLWLTLPTESQPSPVWHVWADGSAFVVSGGQEQPLPDIEDGTSVQVTVPSKDTRGRLVTWVAKAQRVEPGTPVWETAVAALHPGRLNATDGEAQKDRWAVESRITRLTPTGNLPERPGMMPDSSLAVAPPDSPALTRGPLPFVLGRRARRRPRHRR